MASQSEYAAHRGVSRKTITVWKQRGLLVFNANGTVNTEKSDKLVAEHGGKITLRPAPATLLPDVPAGARRVTATCPRCGHMIAAG